MTVEALELCLLLSVTAAACALPGVYLVLRRMALLSDAIGHVLLLGIVVAFLVTSDLKSPWLLLGATLSGLVTVALVEALRHSKLVREDAAIGLVFPAMFSLGVILVTLYIRNVHVDVDAVLLGRPEFALNRRVVVGSFDLGAVSTLIMAGMLMLNLAFIVLFFKELKLGTFDPALAAALGLLPGVLNYVLMGFVSLTVVTAFDAVGSVLVVAFMVVPAAAAYLLTDRLRTMLILSALLGAAGAFAGTWLAFVFHTTIAGTVATVLGLEFALVFAFAPHRGLLPQLRRRIRQRREFFETMLVIHLLQHEGTPEEEEESRLDRLHKHLRWKPADVTTVVMRAERHGWVAENVARLTLTQSGRAAARAAIGETPA